MSDLSTFGGFTAARLGIYAAQKGLSVTGNNIANINTVGYTRQALDQVSLKVGASDRYQSKSNVNVGSGVLCVGVSQLRDPYLDIRYRTEMSNVGALDAQLAGLDQISSILDEVTKNDGDGVLEKLLTDLSAALQNLSGSAGQNDLDSNVRSAATVLVKELNAYAKSLSEIKQNTVDGLRQDLNTVNGLLRNIRDLNASIRKSEIHGDNALEQRDARNQLIDKLSQYIKIDVTYTTEDIGAGQTIEKLIIKMGNANPDQDIETDSSTLINGIFGTQLLTPKANPNYPDPDDPDDPDLPNNHRYLDINDQPTNDPSKAAQEFDGNYNIMLGALTDAKGNIRRTASSDNVEISQAEFDAGVNSKEEDIYGNITKAIEYIKKTITNPGSPAKVEGTAVTGPPFDASGLNTAAIKALGGAASGAVSVQFDNTTNVFQLMVNGVAIGQSAEYTGGFPVADATTISFSGTDGDGNPVDLGSIEIAATSIETDFTANPPTGLTYTAAVAPFPEDKYYEKTTTYNNSNPIALDDNDLYGSLQSTRELLTEKGEFASIAEIAADKNAVTKRGIPYYENMLNALANQLATQFNDANTGYQVDQDGNYVTPDGDILTLSYPDPDPTVADPVTINIKKGMTVDDLDAAAKQVLIDGDYVVKDATGNPVLDDVTGDPIASLDAFLADQGNYLGGPLFSNHGAGNATNDITAANISVSKDWADGKTRIVNSFVRPTGQEGASSQDSSNILHMVALMTTKMDYTITKDPDAGPITYFNGTFHEMLTYMTGTLADDVSATSTMLDTAYGSAVELDTSRDSVSSVDLNDEAMSMMQYQKSYTAACRLMTTLDEILDKLINSTGVAGR